MCHCYAVCHVLCAGVRSCFAFRWGSWLTYCLCFLVCACTGSDGFDKVPVLEWACCAVGVCVGMCRVQILLVCGWLGNDNFFRGNPFQCTAWIVLIRLNESLLLAYVCPSVCSNAEIFTSEMRLLDQVSDFTDVFFSPSGGTRETTPASKPHLGGFWQRKDCEEWQLISICKNDFLANTDYKLNDWGFICIPIINTFGLNVAYNNVFFLFVFRESLSGSTLMSMDTLLEPTLKLASF